MKEHVQKKKKIKILIEFGGNQVYWILLFLNHDEGFSPAKKLHVYS